MTTKSIMSTDIVTVQPTDTVAEVLMLMCREQIHNIPVLDDAGDFVGLFSLRRVTHALLPRAAQLDQERLFMGLNFMPDDDDELLQRLIELGQKPVSELLEKKKKLRFCGPDTPIPELLKLLYDNPTSLPVLVVHGKHKHLEGMVSNWDVLTKIAINLLSKNQQAESSTAADSGHSPEKTE